MEWWSVAARLLDNGTDLRRHLPPPVAGLRVGLICVFLTPEIFMFLLAGARAQPDGARPGPGAGGLEEARPDQPGPHHLQPAQ